METAKTWFLEEVWGLWLQGGSLMIMLLVIALIIYYATLETYFFLKQKTKFKDANKSTLNEWILYPEKAEPEALKMLEFVNEGKETLGEARRRFDEIRSCFLPLVDRRITFLSLLVSTAPLAGLLGTVMGMLTTFKGLSTSSGGKTIDFVAGGISEALITTQTGLIIAIPAYLMINRIVSHRDRLEVFFTTFESLTMQNYKGILEIEEEEEIT
jgi:biopolymer transport protein ExbB|tara:strand:- start:413 stop:1051 length:639 start_codon:yes stop_codon:yes gene_type:complete